MTWKQACLPKSQGGLGLRDLSIWNECLMCKHLWNLARNKESLWVKWINVIRLRGKSIWEVKLMVESSCGWKQMFLRSKRDHVFKKIGDGMGTFLWYDVWNDIGPLNKWIDMELMLLMVLMRI